MWRMSALTVFAHHGTGGAHVSEVGSRLSNWGGTSAPFSQWADLPMADLPYLLIALAAGAIVWWILGRVGDALQSFVDGRATGHRHRRGRLALIAVLGIMIMLGLAAL